MNKNKEVDNLIEYLCLNCHWTGEEYLLHDGDTCPVCGSDDLVENY